MVQRLPVHDRWPPPLAACSRCSTSSRLMVGEQGHAARVVVEMRVVVDGSVGQGLTHGCEAIVRRAVGDGVLEGRACDGAIGHRVRRGCCSQQLRCDSASHRGRDPKAVIAVADDATARQARAAAAPRTRRCRRA